MTAAICSARRLRQSAALYMPEPDQLFRRQAKYAEMERITRFVSNALPGRPPGQRSADYHAFPDAARRIADVPRDIPLIAQLHNPVDRANFQLGCTTAAGP